MLLLAKFLHRILLAKNTPFRQIVLIGGGWLKPLQITWRPAVTALPAILAVLAAVGYYYTAQQSALRILQTVAMMLAVLTLGGITRRWLLVNRRRLAREQAKQRRAQILAAVETDSAAPPTPELADDTVDLAALSEQTQTLVRTFLGFTTAVGLVAHLGRHPPGPRLPGEPQAPRRRRAHLGPSRVVSHRVNRDLRFGPRHPRPAGTGDPATPAARQRRPLRLHEHLALRPDRASA